MFLRKLSLFLLLAVSTFSLAAAQGSVPSEHTDLETEGFFGGYFGARRDVTEVHLTGRKLRPYHLDYFRSLTLEPRAGDAENIERAIRRDTRHAVSREEGQRGGRLYYGFYQLRMKSGRSAYIFYRNNALLPPSSPTPPQLTLILMGGNATLAELKRAFAK